MVQGNHVQVSAYDADNRIARIPLYIQREHVADWRYTMSINMDRESAYIKVLRSNFSLIALVDKNPLVRYEYDASMHTAPVAHWQFHAERGAFSHLLGRAQGAGKDVKPHSLSSLHFPVGGGRMRAGLEDLIEFLIRECHVDSRGGWLGALQESRENYRIIQARTLARDAQTEVAAVLAEQGWTVSPPPSSPELNVEELRRW